MKRKYIAFVGRRFAHVGGAPGCSAETLPAVDFNFCDPEVRLSEIQRVFLAKINAAPFADWTQAEEWTTRMSETSTDLNAIRALMVVGDKPQPTKTTKDISGGRKFTTRKDHVLNLTVDEVTEDNHSFLQGVEVGTRFRMWYETSGGLMFGGNDGIVVELQGDMLLPRGAGEIMTYVYTVNWVSQTTEQRCASPIFGQTVFGETDLDTTILFDTDATPINGACDFELEGGTNAVAKFQYNTISPAIGTAITMTIKISTTLVLTCNMTLDYEGAPFSYTHTTGTVYTGFITDGDVLF